MKKLLIALAVIGFAIGANAQTVNFTNSCTPRHGRAHSF